jgi:hypothetical protein
MGKIRQLLKLLVSVKSILGDAAYKAALQALPTLCEVALPLPEKGQVQAYLDKLCPALSNVVAPLWEKVLESSEETPVLFKDSGEMLIAQYCQSPEALRVELINALEDVDMEEKAGISPAEIALIVEAILQILAAIRKRREERKKS